MWSILLQLIRGKVLLRKVQGNRTNLTPRSLNGIRYLIMNVIYHCHKVTFLHLAAWLHCLLSAGQFCWNSPVVKCCSGAARSWGAQISPHWALRRGEERGQPDVLFTVLNISEYFLLYTFILTIVTTRIWQNHFDLCLRICWEYCLVRVRSGLVECNKYDLSPLRPGRRRHSGHKIARLAFYEIEFFIRIKTWQIASVGVWVLRWDRET